MEAIDFFEGSEQFVESSQEGETATQDTAQEVETPQEVNTEAETAEVEQVVEEPTTEAEEATELKNVQVNKRSELTDEDVLNYIKSKGIEVEDLESLSAPKTQYANSYVENLNKFIADTGRSIEEFNFIQTDLKEMSPETLIKANLERENPELTDKQIDFLYKKDYGKVDIDEDYMSEEDIENAKEQNEFAEIKAKQDARKALEAFEQLQRDYSVPKENHNKPQEDAQEYEGFSDSLKNELGSIDSLVFDIGKDASFTYNVSDTDIPTPMTPKEFIDSYKGEDGKFNQEKFATDLLLLHNIDKIIASSAESKYSEGVEKVVKGLKNQNLSTTETKTNKPQSGTSLVDALFD